MRRALNPRNFRLFGRRVVAVLALALIVASCGGDDPGDSVPVPDTQPPDVGILTPTAGPVSGVIELRASAFDNRGVVGVSFQIDGVAHGGEVTTTPYSIGWDTRAATNGNHVITATARDEVGNVGTSAGVSVNVSGGITP